MTFKFKTVLCNLCPYTHLWRAFKRMVREKKMSETTRTGAFVACLGLFCPFFWIALLSGASKTELIFHATHSGVVFLIGVIMLLIGLAREKLPPESRDSSA